MMQGSLKLLFVADGRSPIALNWIGYFTAQGYEVHLVSTFPCEPPAALASFEVLPVALGGAAGKPEEKHSGRRGALRRAVPVELRTAVRQWLGPLTLPKAARRLNAILSRLRPDLIHAMRIPYEGMLAAQAIHLGNAQITCPLLISVWGNDFTLHAPSTPLMARQTSRALKQAGALHTDCQRDLRLAHRWGFSPEKPGIVLPGNGGVSSDLFYPSKGNSSEGPPMVINPRGFRPYVQNRAFFRSLPMVLRNEPETRIICPAMAGEEQAIRWLEDLNISSAVSLLPLQTRSQMGDLFRKASIVVSPTTHDGTPNTVLEAMACGCFPVVGDIEALREWIIQGENGLLVNPLDPTALAGAILTAIKQRELRARAAEINTRLIAERADYRRVMMQAERFYQELAV
jgi:glycosyltransferase involved in cell wall biosynthesis